MTPQPLLPPVFATIVLVLLALIAIGVLWIGYRTRPAQITVAIESVKATAEWTDDEWAQLVAQLADVPEDPATNVVPMTRQRGRNTRNSRPAPEPGGES